MKIRKVEAFLLTCGFDPPIVLPFYGGERTILKRDAMLIKVTADNGLVGYAPGPAHERAAAEIAGPVAEFLGGRDPRDWRELRFPGSIESIKTYHAVEVALIDLAAKFEGATMSDLLGGRKRDRIRCYGSAGMYMPPQGYAEEAAAVRAMGFAAYKMRPAAGPEQDLETVRAMRAATGPDFGLMLDAHAWWRMGDRSYTPATIEALAREMALCGLVWLEEPLPPSDHAAYRDLRGKKIVPIAAGEHEPDEASFTDLIATGAVDYAQMDVCCQGGFALGLRVFEACRHAGVRFAFHQWGTVLEALAAAQLGACWEDDVVEWLEYPCYSNGGRPGMYPFPAADEILGEPLQIEGGNLVLPAAPGLGVEVDEGVVERYPYKPGPWSIFRLDSPAQTLAIGGDHSVEWLSDANSVG
jgi:L-alanine-DL-glutamate epimerase-like enolase superfamily enzyme